MKTEMQIELLRSILSAVREDLKPELQTSQAKHRGELVDMMLARLAAEVELGAGLSTTSVVAPQQLKQLSQGEGLGSNAKAALEKSITGFVATEHPSRTEVEKRLAEISTVSTAKKVDIDNLDIPRQTFTDYLRRKFPEQQDINVTKVTVIPGGRSKGTILLDVNSSRGEDAIVIRRDFQANPTGVSVTYEYPIIVALWEQGIPVPEPRWIEEDTSILGGAFIAFSKVPGKAMGTLFFSDAPPEFAKDFAATLAQLHTVDIRQTGIAKQLNWGLDEHPVRAMVDHFYQNYLRDAPATPLMEVAFAWLYLQLENIEFEFGFVHGDSGFHNTLGENNKLTGLLDWEFAHAGDPAEDLTYCKGLIEQIIPWDTFLEAYTASGGKPLATARLQFFDVWRSVQLGVHMGRAASLFTSGASRDLRLAAIGFNSFPKIMNDLAASLAAYTK